MRKKLIILVVVVSALLAGELAREKAVYIVRQRALESAYWSIDKKMRSDNGFDKKDVEKLLGPPDKVEPDTGGELWSWSSETSRGRLWRLFSQPRGRYELQVAFDPNSRAVNVYSGDN